MLVVDILIKKVEELTRAVNSIRLSSKKIHELPDISGQTIYVVASNGVESGKVLLLPNNGENSNENINPWTNISLSPYSNFFLDNQNNSYNFIVDTQSWNGKVPIIKGFSESKASDGLVGYLRNSSENAIVLKHNVIDSSNVITPFYLSSNSDYQIKPNEILSFKYSKERNQCELSVYDSGAVVPNKPISEVFRLTDQDLSNSESVFLELKNEPIKSDFVNVFCNGVFLNPAGIEVKENYLVINRKAVEYEFKPGMRITANYKY